MKPTESRKRYNDYPAYFKELFGERVQKLSIDGGFTCPNRDGKKGTGGCTFCNNESFNVEKVKKRCENMGICPDFYHRYIL